MNNVLKGGVDDSTDPNNVKNVVRRLSMQMQMMVDMSDQFLLDRAKWIVERFGKHKDLPQPWEIIPPMVSIAHTFVIPYFLTALL